MDHNRLPIQGVERWAWIAGASEGLGLAFADELAQRGYSLVLFARHKPVLETQAERLRASYQVDVVAHALDLSACSLEQYRSDIDETLLRSALVGAKQSVSQFNFIRRMRSLIGIVDFGSLADLQINATF